MIAFTSSSVRGDDDVLVNFVSSFTMAVMSSEELSMTDVVSSSTSFSLPSTLRQQAPSKPFRRQLYGRKRVLYLVGESFGDLAPGGELFGPHDMGDIVEGHDIPLGLARIIAQCGEGDAQE